jgi:hypothetical protein
MSAACFTELVEQLQPFSIRRGVILEALQLMLALGWEEDIRACLIHVLNKSLDLWLKDSQRLEERGNPWNEISTSLWPCFVTGTV